jgi:hypothetical protein
MKSASETPSPIVEELLRVVGTDPFPAGYTSSYWQHYGRQTRVEREGNGLALHGAAFGTVTPSPALAPLRALERLSYRPVTSRLSSYRRVWAVARRLARQLGFGLTFDIWRQAVALALLTDHWDAQGLLPRRFAFFGDGYGFLSALVRRMRPESSVYCIDLPKTLVFQACTHTRAEPGASMTMLLPGRIAAADSKVCFVVPPAVENVPGPIDCAVSIACMQEMNAFTIGAYFAFLRRRSGPESRFYCVSRSRKELPGGEVSCFAEYPWQPEDEVFLDGLCPYYTHFLAPYTLPSGPRLLGARMPFVNHFDGVTVHRLVRLAPLASGRAA